MHDIESEIDRRIELLHRLKEDKQKQSDIMEACRYDIIVFFDHFLYTDRNAIMMGLEGPKVIPFMLFDYQREFIIDAWDAIQQGNRVKERTYITLEQDTKLPSGKILKKGTKIPKGTDVFSEKSRQMGFSWIFAMLQLYSWLFHDMKSLYIAAKGEDVDEKGNTKSHFEKLRFLIRKLPVWMLPKGFSKESGTEYNKNMLISYPGRTSSISGETANADAGRGGTYNFVILDEMGSMQYANAINTSVSACTPCRFYNSTPKGKGNEYYRMRLLADKQLIRGHRYHWSENPYYTQEWYDAKTQGMDKVKIAQELEIDYSASVEGRVYPEFIGKTYDIEFDEYKPLYISIDNSHGGPDPNAIIVCQKDGQYLNILDCVEFGGSLTKVGPTEMANILAGEPNIEMSARQNEFYDRYRKFNWKKAIFVSDPHDTNATIDTGTISQAYRKVGIHLNIPELKGNSIEFQIMKTASNISRLKVHDRCADFINAMENARYPEVKEGSNRTTANTKPVHNWTSHYRTSLEYLMVFLTDNEEMNPNKKPTKLPFEVKDPVTGQIRIVYR